MQDQRQMQQHQQQILQQKKQQFREHAILKLQQQLAQEHTSFAINHLTALGMDPVTAYATVLGQAGLRPGAVDLAGVAHLQPAVSSLSSFADLGSQQTLTLSELLPR